MTTSKTQAVMILAAGEGRRMLPLTRHMPKACVPVADKPLVAYALDHVARYGADTVIINAYYQRQVLYQTLGTRWGGMRIRYSEEKTLLETGGGVVQALPLLGGAAAFFVINCDSLWMDGVQPALSRLAAAWQPDRMDALLLMHPTVKIADPYLYQGDFLVAPDGRLRRRGPLEMAAHTFIGVQILSAAAVEALGYKPGERFSLNVLYDRAADAGRLYGIVHDGRWFHVSRPQDVALAEYGLRV